MRLQLNLWFGWIVTIQLLYQWSPSGIWIGRPWGQFGRRTIWRGLCVTRNDVSREWSTIEEDQA